MPIAKKWYFNLCNLTPESLVLNISLISPLHLLYYFNKQETIAETGLAQWIERRLED